MFAQWMTWAAVTVVALFVTVSPQSQDVRDVARAYLQRHGVPCRVVTHVDRTDRDLDMIATCQDGREWALFFVEGEVAFVQAETREPYRWRRDVYASDPQVYGISNWFAEDL
jgi:hypothetical protein